MEATPWVGFSASGKALTPADPERLDAVQMQDKRVFQKGGGWRTRSVCTRVENYSSGMQFLPTLRT